MIGPTSPFTLVLTAYPPEVRLATSILSYVSSKVEISVGWIFLAMESVRLEQSEDTERIQYNTCVFYNKAKSSLRLFQIFISILEAFTSCSMRMFWR